MTRTERENIISVLLDLGRPITTWVISLKNSEEEAKEYISKMVEADRLLSSLGELLTPKGMSFGSQNSP